MNRYNFVILGTNNLGGLYKISYKDAIALENVVFLDGNISSKGSLYRFLYKLHCSIRINRLFPLPMKKIWNVAKIVFLFHNPKPLCFILFSEWVRIAQQTKLFSFLREKYPECKIVWFVQDKICTIRNAYTGKPVDVVSIKNKCDLVISYDMGDAKKFGLEYHPTVLSKIQIPLNQRYESDVFFLGKSKKRLNLLIELSKGLKKNGIKCNFMVLGVPPKERKEPEYINYIDKPLSYYENLNYAANAKCLLELMQPDAVGYTFRTSEALLYGKKLITNNRAIRDALFYNEDGIIVLDELSSAFFEQTAKKILDKKNIRYENIDLISPRHLLSFIEYKLENVRNDECV